MARIVLAPGEADGHDSEHVAYYGTVKRVGDELWMWYLGQGPVEYEDENHPWFQRVCLARSKDGYNWERPNLGLVEYNGTVFELEDSRFHAGLSISGPPHPSLVVKSWSSQIP